MVALLNYGKKKGVAPLRELLYRQKNETPSKSSHLSTLGSLRIDWFADEAED